MTARSGAIVLAAGEGRRFGGSEAKQFAQLSGEPVVAHSIRAFVAHPGIDEVWVVGAAAEFGRLRACCGPGVDRFVVGGATRSASVAAAAAETQGRLDRVLVHDAARPLVPEAVVTRVLDALETFDAVATVVPVADTIVEITDGGMRSPDRDAVHALQTPQGFDSRTLRSAHARQGDTTYTDDVSMVAALVSGARVTCVAGDRRLHKVTTVEDLVAVQAWLDHGLG